MRDHQKSPSPLPEAGKVLVLGVTGGIASGKSTVADMLAELGAPMIDFDQLAREVAAPDQPAFRDIVDCFGEAVVAPDGTLDRKRLSDMVFRDPAKRKILEGMTHPRIFEAFRSRLKTYAQTDPNGMVQAVIPLLYEVHLETLVHKVLVVYAPRHIQIERLMQRDQITREAATRILDAQMPIDEKAARADYVIHNQGDLDKTRNAVTALWQKLKEACSKRG